MFHYEREPVSPLRRRFIDDLRVRNKSPRTIETYVLRVVQFTKHFGRARRRKNRPNCALPANNHDGNVGQPAHVTGKRLHRRIDSR